MTANADFAGLLNRFFTTYLCQQRQASPHTITSYRDTFRLLVTFAWDHLDKAPQDLSVDDIDSGFIGEFLTHIETDRGNHPRTRNTRLSAIRSLMRFIALQDPRHAFLVQKVLAIPDKRYTRRPIDYLDSDEIGAVLQAPDQSTWVGRRDHVLLLLAVQTGMRASELITLKYEDVHLGKGAHIRCHGKGRKERCVPLRHDSIVAMEAWIEEQCGKPNEPVFVNQRGRPLQHDNINYLVTKNVTTARIESTTLRNKRITPHSLRHTCAMAMLQDKVDLATIALWLGHDKVETTYIYVHANLKMKEEAMAKTTASGTAVERYQPEDRVLAFLNSL